MWTVLFLAGLLIAAATRWSSIFIACLSCIFTALGRDRVSEDDRPSEYRPG